jgi:mannose/fructose/N-acetylgalactosamine-specific phosphotransferase system component IID
MGNINLDNMQGTGFAWLVKPYLRKYRLSKDDDLNLSSYFTTNPSFITLVAGVFIKEYPNGRANTLKSIYASASAALGDSFFYHATRPMLFLMSVFLCLTVSPYFVLFYPVSYIAMRVFMLVVGWHMGMKYGEQSIMMFNRVKANRWADFSDSVSVFMLGVLFSYAIQRAEADAPVFTHMDFILTAAAATIAFVVGWRARRYVRLNIFMWAVIIIVFILLGFYGGLNHA